MTKKKYEIRLRSPHQSLVDVESENVHVTQQGNVKFLNGKGNEAELVAFFNASDVISVTQKS